MLFLFTIYQEMEEAMFCWVCIIPDTFQWTHMNMMLYFPIFFKILSLALVQLYMYSAAEIWSPGRQMQPMNPLGDPRSYHRWSVWRPMDALGFAENVLEWKCRDDSTDALISNLHCSLVNCGPRLVHYEYFWLVAWFQQIIDWRTTQNWDGPPNQQPWVVR